MPVTATAEVVRTASTYILVAACIERYLYAHDLGGLCSNRKRTIALAAFAAFSLAIKGTIVFELKVIDRRPLCEGLAEFILTTNTQLNRYYKLIWTFWVRAILGNFCPFTLLIIFNIAVVMSNTCTCLKVDTDKDSGDRIIRLKYHRIGARRGGLADLHAPDEVYSPLDLHSSVNRERERAIKGCTLPPHSA